MSATAGRVAVATCRAVPNLDDDGPLLLAALHEVGLDARPEIWDSKDVPWSTYDLVLVRSTWDYVLRRDEFLAWARRCRRTANPRPVLEWSTDKRHLTDLAAVGVPAVPTVFLRPGQPLAVPDDWQEIVVKPTISASAADTGRYPKGHPDASALVRRLHRGRREAMVQPYLPAIDKEGETALVYLGGRLSHAVRKAALLETHGERQPVIGDEARTFITASSATPAQLLLADRALQAAPGGPDALTYARVDPRA